MDPYQLRNLTIDRPNQVWCADITFIPLGRDYLYLVAIMDWHSRRVLAWRLSNTLDASFCTEALDEALATYGPPEIMNTDQGCQFTSLEFTETLKAAQNPGRVYHGCMLKRMVRRLVSAAAVLIVTFALVLSPAVADEPNQGSALSEKRARFALGVGWIYADFSTTFETLEKDPERRFFLSLEGDLGLPASSSVPTLDLLARVGKKSFIAANLGRFDRSRTLLEIDEDLHFDDLVLEAGADVDLFFNVTDIDVAYGHAYVDDERVRVIGKFGLSLLDLDIGVLAEGGYRIGDHSDEGSYELSASLIVPVPLVGVIFDVDLSRRWALTSSVELFYMPVSDITAQAWRAQIHVRYSFGRTVGVILGYSTFDIEVVEDTDVAKSTIAYTMNGFSAGLLFSF